MMETDRTLIIVPTYNERENVGALIEQLLQIAPDADIAIIDDNSPDGTPDEVHRMFGTNARVSVFTRSSSPSFRLTLVDYYPLMMQPSYLRLLQLAAYFSNLPTLNPS